jgi:hypothetical protein
MRFVLNLCSDLAKLNDAELPDRLATTWRAYGMAEQDSQVSKAFWEGTLKYSARGPIRHPWAHLFSSIVRAGRQFGPPLVLYVSMSPTRSSAVVNMHLNLCEIRDIQDEIERRKSARLGPK